jgi:hypothetical protein
MPAFLARRGTFQRRTTTTWSRHAPPSAPVCRQARVHSTQKRAPACRHDKRRLQYGANKRAGVLLGAKQGTKHLRAYVKEKHGKELQARPDPARAAAWYPSMRMLCASI